MGRLDGKVAFITGVARGQGRSHAVRLAEEGARIIGVDGCGGTEAYPWADYAMADESDLAETVSLVESAGGEIVATKADVRDIDALRSALEVGLRKFGRLDVVSANAGIVNFGPEAWRADDRQWLDIVAVNWFGVRNTCQVSTPALIEGSRGGSIVITSSGAGLKGSYGLADYCATKAGVIGLAKALAAELAPHGIRVNTIAPGSVNTPMVQNTGMRRMFRPDLEDPTSDDVAQLFMQRTMLEVPWVEAVDISNALLFLASEEARFITGVVLPVDAGMSTK